MKRQRPEPGLLEIFHLYVYVRLGLLVFTALVYLLLYGLSFRTDLLPIAILFLVDLAFLLVFLAWPWFRQHLGAWHLPAALIVASVVPIVESRYLYDVYGADAAAGLLVVIPFLAVPLILTAWQYDLEQVIWFCMGTAAFEIALVMLYGTVGASRPEAEIEVILVRTVLFILIGYTVHNLVSAQRRQRAELARANLKLARYAAAMEQLSITRERSRLARELHDTLAHTLSGLAVQLEAVTALWDQDRDRARNMLIRALESTRSGLTETRRALQALRATPLEDMGLPEAIRELAESAAERGHLDLDLAIDADLPCQPADVGQALYRVAQEALDNAVTHAHASRLRVGLQQDDGAPELIIADDGDGIPPDATDAKSRFGLRGMRERAEIVGGNLTIESAPGQGTTVRMRVTPHPPTKGDA
jgi:signal transduction histidine kinase